MSEEFDDIVRSSSEVARRSLALFGCIGLAFGSPKSEIVSWLKENDLEGDLSPTEALFINESKPSRKQIIDTTWHSERLIVLLWALGYAGMPEADEQCDTSVLQDALPPYAEIGAGEFTESAKLRPDNELIAMADKIRNLHWVARDAELHNHSPEERVSLGIIQERHHAINWIIGYDGLDWDEVTTDT
jgi:hypothetical protein